MTAIQSGGHGSGTVGNVGNLGTLQQAVPQGEYLIFSNCGVVCLCE